MALEHEGKYWVEVDDAARYERITRREVYRRMKVEERLRANGHPLVSIERRELVGQVSGIRSQESGVRRRKSEERLNPESPRLGGLNPKGGRLIDPLSMTFDAQVRWREELLKQVSGAGCRVSENKNLKPETRNLKPASRPAHEAAQPSASTALNKQVSGVGCQVSGESPGTRNPAPGACPPQRVSGVRCQVSGDDQLPLLPPTEWDRKVAALDAPAPQRAVILGRFRAIRPLVNHDYKALGHPSKTSYIRETAAQCGVSQNTLWRWFWQYMEHQDLRDLANEAPGPAALGAGSQALDASMRAFIKECWINKKFNKKQVYRELIQYLTEKQRGCGLSYAYKFPSEKEVFEFSESTVNRFIEELDALDQAERQGADVVKAALGHIDRAYDDLASLERVETDEWKYDCRAYDERRPRVVRRYWLLTFYDVRSLYPLSWELVAGSEYDVRHGIAQEDEINLLVKLVREYGVPGALHSDRGRFRGQTFGGRPLHEKIDQVFAKANGILDQLGIRRNMPREHNPRGTRLERFHRYLADCCRKLPGWIGSNTRERKMAPGDAQEREHMEFVHGARSTTPLLSRAELAAKTAEWMEAWREHPSEGTGMRGLSPRAVFVHNAPGGGFRKVSEEELAWVTAEHFDNETIEAGGIVTLPDGKRYSHPSLLLIQGEKRECVRLRDDHSFISALPARKGEEAIHAERRVPVGANDPEGLARASEFQGRLRKLKEQMAGQVSGGAGPEPEAPNPKPALELSSVETMMNRKRRPPRGQPIDPQEFIAAESEKPAKAAPSLYEFEECKAEEL